MKSAEHLRGREIHKPCPFCEIVAEKTAAGIIYKSRRAIVFAAREDGYPLIATRKHFTSLLDLKLDDATARELGSLQKRMAQLVCRVDKVDSVTIAINNGSAAGQDVGHLHIHVMPRTEGDNMVFLARGERFSIGKLMSRASKYREGLNDIA